MDQNQFVATNSAAVQGFASLHQAIVSQVTRDLTYSSASPACAALVPFVDSVVNTLLSAAVTGAGMNAAEYLAARRQEIMDEVRAAAHEALTRVAGTIPS